MKETGSFEIEFDTEENATKAGERIKAYIYEKDPKGYEWTGSPDDDGWAEELEVDECTVWTESDITWDNFDLLVEGIASLLDNTMKDSVIRGSFSYLNELMGNVDHRRLVVSDDGISVVNNMSLTDCYNNWSALCSDREWIRNQILDEGSFTPDDLDANCVLCSRQYRQQAFETLLGDISDEELEQVKDYYLDTLADVDDNLVDEIENDTPRQACMKVLEQYWKENAEDFDTLEDMLMSICEECRCDIDVELVEPEIDDDQKWISCAAADDEEEIEDDEDEDDLRQKWPNWPHFLCDSQTCNYLMGLEYADDHECVDISVDYIDAPFWFVFSSDEDYWYLRAFKRDTGLGYDTEYCSKSGTVTVSKATGEGSGSATDPMLQEYFSAFFDAFRNLSFYAQENNWDAEFANIHPRKAGVELTTNGENLMHQLVEGEERPDVAIYYWGRISKGRPFCWDDD